MCAEVVRFVSLEGKLKQFRRQLSEIHFDIKPESVGKYNQLCCVYRSHRWTGLKANRLSRKILQTNVLAVTGNLTKYWADENQEILSKNICRIYLWFDVLEHFWSFHCQ